MKCLWISSYHGNLTYCILCTNPRGSQDQWNKKATVRSPHLYVHKTLVNHPTASRATSSHGNSRWIDCGRHTSWIWSPHNTGNNCGAARQVNFLVEKREGGLLWGLLLFVEVRMLLWFSESVSLMNIVLLISSGSFSCWRILRWNKFSVSISLTKNSFLKPLVNWVAPCKPVWCDYFIAIFQVA